MIPARAEAAPAAPAAPGRERPELLAFTGDAATEAALREGLAQVLPPQAEFRRGGAHQAIAALQNMPSPRVLVIDVAGEAQPLAVLEDLAQVLEPDVRVLVIGDREDMDFYRRITRGLGAQEYLFKPLLGSVVARLFAPVFSGRAEAHDLARGGRVIAVSGTRGGAGASTIAASLAWHLAEVERRHTLLLDADLHSGIAALLLGTEVSPALREALQNPGRLDDLFVERAVQSPGARLRLLASEEGLVEPGAWTQGAAERLLRLLRRHYNFVIIDLPIRPLPLLRDLRDLAQQQILVLDPSLPAMRDALRLLALPTGTAQARRPLLVLNRADRPGGLAARQVEEALQAVPDIVIPDLPQPLAAAEALGVPAMTSCRKFADCIARLASEAAGVRQAEVGGGGLLRRLGLRR